MSSTVVVVAAHPDDEVLGCGGTISRLANEGRAVHVLFMADGETSRALSPGSEARDHRIAMRSLAAEEAGKVMGCASVECLGLPDNRMDGLEMLEVIQRIEAYLLRHRPLTVLTHHSGDLNIDHQITHRAVVTACRPQPGQCVKELLFFEVPSSTEWQSPGSAQFFAPNWFVDIGLTMPKKLDALRIYASELRAFPHPRSIEAVVALAAWRGSTVGAVAAEAFVLGRKLIV